MRHVFNENIAPHFAAFVQQKHKDGAEERRSSQAVFLHLLQPAVKGDVWEISSDLSGRFGCWFPTAKAARLWGFLWPLGAGSGSKDG